MTRRVPLLLTSLLIVVAACSDSGDSSNPESSPSVPAAVDVTPSVATTAVPNTTSSQPATSTTGAESTTTTAATTTTTAVPLVPLTDIELALTEVASGFEQPVLVTPAPGEERLFVVDQPGRIWSIDGDSVELFLDIRERVVFGGEQGLLGMAFPADYETSGVFYVNYTGRSNSGAETRVASFATDGTVADSDSEQVILRVSQPASNHNGGMIAFGPDGNLWVGMGDGGARDDRFGQGQNAGTLLGSMLRIAAAPDGYTIPPGNPVETDPEFAPEVWAIGVRNPWRFSFDGNDLWMGDVGQDNTEEINQVDAGEPALNFGWPLFEGTRCYLSGCDDTGLTPPVTEYGHSDGCSVTGGYVYRGDAIPELDGHYLYGDFCGGWVRSFAPSGETWEWFAPGTISGLASFGTDAAGEVYVVSTGGTIWRIDRV